MDTAKLLEIQLANQWQYPGGKVEENETYRQGAIRELEEETGIKKNKTDLKYIMTHRFEKITCKVFLIEGIKNIN